MADFWIMLGICLPLGAVMCLLMIYGKQKVIDEGVPNYWKETNKKAREEE